MQKWFHLRTWAGPLTIGSFFVLAITGILMFFHLNIGMIKLAHEMMSWLFVIGAVAHIIVNWKAFLGYFRTRGGAAIIAVVVLLGTIFSMPIGGQRGHHPFLEMMNALEQSSLEVVAKVLKCDPLLLIQQLQTQGIQIHQPTQTLAEIAAQNQKNPMEIWTALLSSKKQSE